ncbi:MAG: AAA family ATPase [Coleofasciculus sp. G1-WW12-02]|uniref:AAA family ATPase n=1 Tax=Coleofasciculus sp. G1-WW12-02 TaxID=3068483 RepID=UPI0033011EA6
MVISEINTVAFPLSVVSINVKRLFGRYTYNLQLKDKDTQLENSLLILYGDNGSGKTTILNLLFHLLSPGQNRGHRTVLAQIPFAEFSVSLADGTHIVASREPDQLTGSFQVQLLRGKDDVTTANYKVDHNGKLRGEDDAFLQSLSNLQINIYLLGDDRVLSSDAFEEDDSDILIPYNIKMKMQKAQRFLFEDMDQGLYRPLSIIKSKNIHTDIALRTSIQRAEEWIREQALKGSNAGSANVHNLYEEILTRIINSGEAAIEERKGLPGDLIEALKVQQKRSEDFSGFGLMSPLSNQKLIDTLKNAAENTHSIILDVLQPYLDSVNARMDALQYTQDLLTLFVDTINNIFFRDKRIRLHVREGISIMTESGMEILPEMLSSGEKQLLLLFCNTLTAREQATIFIIDEPEISLNIKWQRQFIRTLLALTEGSQVQFMLATHSLELLAQYRRNVIKLENQAD